MKLISKGDKLDKYRAHLIEGAPLSEEEHLMLSRYRRAMAMLLNGETLQSTVRALKSDVELSESQRYTIVSDAKRLFGNVHEADKQGLRYLHYENYIRLAKKAEDAGDFKTAKLAWDSASKLESLFAKEDKTHGLDPMAFMKATAIVFTTDPEVFKQQQRETGAEDIDFEEVPPKQLEE